MAKDIPFESNEELLRKLKRFLKAYASSRKEIRRLEVYQEKYQDIITGENTISRSDLNNLIAGLSNFYSGLIGLAQLGQSISDVYEELIENGVSLPRNLEFRVHYVADDSETRKKALVKQSTQNVEYLLYAMEKVVRK